MNANATSIPSHWSAQGEVPNPSALRCFIGTLLFLLIAGLGPLIVALLAIIYRAELGDGMSDFFQYGCYAICGGLAYVILNNILRTPIKMPNIIGTIIITVYYAGNLLLCILTRYTASIVGISIALFFIWLVSRYYILEDEVVGMTRAQKVITVLCIALCVAATVSYLVYYRDIFRVLLDIF